MPTSAKIQPLLAECIAIIIRIEKKQFYEITYTPNPCCGVPGDPRRLKITPPSAFSGVGDCAEGGNDDDAVAGSEGSRDLPLTRYAPGILVWVLLSRGKKPMRPSNTDGKINGGDALALHKKRRDKKDK